MNIKIGNYRIESDKTQFILHFERKKGSFPGVEVKEGETTEEVVGYYSSIESLLLQFPSRMLMRSSATSLREVIDELERYRKLVQESIKGA